LTWAPATRGRVTGDASGVAAYRRVPKVTGDAETLAAIETFCPPTPPDPPVSSRVSEAVDVLRRGLAGNATVEEWTNNNDLLRQIEGKARLVVQAVSRLERLTLGLASNQVMPRPADDSNARYEIEEG